MNPRFLLLLSVLLSSSSFFLVEGATKEYTLVLTWDTVNIACVDRWNILVNGQFPGPPITADTGDTLIVHVVNQLVNETASIHYHGFHQTGTPFYDGLSAVSQCPIPPGDSFTHVIELGTTAGTFFYHFHRLLYAMSVYGPLIVYDDYARAHRTPFGGYDEERIVLLSDFYKRNDSDLLSGIMDPDFVWIGDPDAVLINGRSIVNCSLVSPPFVCTAGTCDVSSIWVEPGKTYRLRVIGATGLSFLSFAIEGHTMEVVEADGFFVEPVNTSLLLVNSGQRYSVILRTKTWEQLEAEAEAEGTVSLEYWVSAYIRWRPVDPLNGVAVLKYTGAPRERPSLPTPGSLQNYSESPEELYPIRSSPLDRNVPALPAVSDRTMVLVGRQERDFFNRIKWTVNHVAYVFPNGSAVLPYVYFNRTAELTAPETPVQIQYGEVIDIVIQDTSAINTICEQHSWHIHGHSMWVLGTGPGQWNGTTEQMGLLNFVNPPYRDSVTVFPYSDAYFTNASTRDPAHTPCGWTYVRFIAENPGVWPIHCHVTAHMELGMLILFEEASDRLPPIPPRVLDNFRLCFDVPTGFESVTPGRPPYSPPVFSPHPHHPFSSSSSSSPFSPPWDQTQQQQQVQPTTENFPSSQTNSIQVQQNVININFEGLFHGLRR